MLKALEDEVLIPTVISERSDIKTNHISKILGELIDKELIEIINPEVRKGRLYRLTDEGKGVVRKLE